MNNLKAERTLTAEELQAIIDGCDGVTPGPWKYEGSIYEHMGAGLRSLPDDKGFAQLWKSGTVAIDAAHIARLDPDTVKAMALELQYLRSQSLSTQQPMGEVHTEASPEFQCEWDENEYTVSWKGGPWIHIFASGKIAVNDGTGIRSFMVQDLGASALHPNQESGE